MLTQIRWFRRLSPAVVLFWVLAPGLATAQKSKGLSTPFPDFGFSSSGNGQKVSFQASYELQASGKSGRLHLTAEIESGWHIYSTTQAAGGPNTTVIELLSEQVKRSGPFVPDHAPEISMSDAFPGLPIEEHQDIVTWTAPFSVTKTVDPEQDKLEVSVVAQVCKTDGACIMVDEKVVATYQGTYEEKLGKESLRVEQTQAEWTATVEPAAAKPGSTVELVLNAKLDPGYHVYPFTHSDETQYRTVIVATSKAGLHFGAPFTKSPIAQDKRLETPIDYHDGDVTWRIPVSIPANAQEGEHPIEIQVGFMTCSDRNCSPQSGLSATGKILVSHTAVPEKQAAAMRFTAVAYKDVVDRPSLVSWIDVPSTTAATKAPLESGNGLEIWMVFAALAGGFILNFMPCVLPVIGLKLMSFVNQSGSSRAKVISLNLSYVAGILAVMLVLALANVLAKTAGEAFGWGQQFTRIEFQVPMAVLIFAMALSFLGVWEIPIPGFAMSSKSGELMEQEGLGGAFFKGILTTLLATPCSGPFLGTLFGLTLTLSIPSIVILYLLVGIGLGLPYLAICVYPGVIKFLPKPGSWMDTLKQVLAFPLLFTVVYFVAMITPDYRVATLVLLISVWFACWLIGRVPAYAEAHRIRAAWLTGVATSVLGGVLAFSYFGPVEHDVPWIPYDEAVLAKYRSEGKTVMIEFTARWCLTCQANMKFAIDRPRVAELVNENKVVPLLADWSEPSDAILNKIKELDSLSIPLLAIYPADPAMAPIVLRDRITESELIEALQEAGPSQPKTKLTNFLH